MKLDGEQHRNEKAETRATRHQEPETRNQEPKTEKSNSYRDLVAWQQAMELVYKVYHLSACFPDCEKFGLTSQLRRSAVSVPSNIAEGQGRNSKGEFLQFLGHAKGSLHELETQLLIAEHLRYVDEQASRSIFEQCSRVSKLLNGLLQSLRSQNVS